MSAADSRPGFGEMFTPKLISTLREGYGLGFFRADALAGLTVAIVALPLSMAIAIAAGAPPQTGLTAAIVGGFLVSALGGCRFQVGGPAGAFIVVVAAAIARHGMDGFLLATFMAGCLLLLVGWLRLGTYIKYIPYPVTIGFTAGIAVIIFVSQLRELLGLRLEQEPGEFVPKIAALWNAAASINSVAIAISVSCIAIIIGLRMWKPRFPGFLVAVTLAAVATAAFHLPVETIGSRFGGLPRGLPWPVLPALSFARMLDVAPAAFTFALLGGIESLLSAVVADGMSGRSHRSNCELVAQGVANIASACFGGICVTGTIARTATNVRAHAHGPVAGMLHALFLLAFMILAAPLADTIPLAALSAVLAVVCWNMADKADFWALLKHDRGDAFVLLATFFLTIFRNLTEGIAVGVVLGAFLFMHRMAELVEVAADPASAAVDHANKAQDSPGAESGDASDIMVYRIDGPLFFGAAGMVNNVLARLNDWPKTFILDLARVPLADATAAQTLESFITRAHVHRVEIYLANVTPRVRQVLVAHGIDAPLVTFAENEAAARLAARQSAASPV